MSKTFLHRSLEITRESHVFNGKRYAKTWADDFACKLSSAKELISALNKLKKSNAMISGGDRWFVFFYHTHPPLDKRIKHLQEHINKE